MMMVMDGDNLINLLDTFGCVLIGGLTSLFLNIMYAISRSKINVVVSQIYLFVGFYGCVAIFSIFWHYGITFQFFCGFISSIIVQFKIEPDNNKYEKNFSLPKLSWIKILYK